MQLLQMLHDEGHPRLLMVRVCGGSRAELRTPGVPEAKKVGLPRPAPPRCGEPICRTGATARAGAALCSRLVQWDLGRLRPPPHAHGGCPPTQPAVRGPDGRGRMAARGSRCVRVRKSSTGMQNRPKWFKI